MSLGEYPLYFHGHSVGGTNPSLLEAMACSCFILSRDSVSYRSVLEANAYYYSDGKGITSILNDLGETIEKMEAFTVENGD